MVDDKEQDPASRITEGGSEEAIMLDQSQESQQDKKISQSQTEANMLLIVNNMEAQHAIAAPDDVKLQMAIKATKDDINKDEDGRAISANIILDDDTTARINAVYGSVGPAPPTLHHSDTKTLPKLNLTITSLGNP